MTAKADGDRPPKVLIEGVSLVYRPRRHPAVEALRNVDLAVAENELCVLVGASGCGKSTLLRIVAGLARPTTGSVRVDNASVTEPGPDRGMVFQSYTLFPWLTVRENVAFGSRVRKLSREQQREVTTRFLDLVGLTSASEAYPRTLSGGMQQRVAIARALANSPSVLLMDEPFGALDAQTRVTMQELLLNVWESDRKTVIFVTHDIDEALLLGDRVVVMSRAPGRVNTVVRVEFPRPRALSLRSNREFIELRDQVADLIRHDPASV